MGKIFFTNDEGCLQNAPLTQKRHSVSNPTLFSIGSFETGVTDLIRIDCKSTVHKKM